MLNGNFLQGSLPTSLFRLPLVNFWVSNNAFTGTIPPEIRNLRNLTFFSAFSNKLVGSLPASISEIIGLEGFQLYNNALTGTIPNSYGNLKFLKQIQLQSNRIRGSIPSSFGLLANLQYLKLSRNRLVGKIPAVVNMSNLIELSISRNRISGSIPQEIGFKLNSVQSIDFSDNKMKGQIPESLFRLTRLKALQISRNDISGAIPGTICRLQASLISLDFSFNRLDGTVPSCLSSFKVLSNLALTRNRFTGNGLGFLTAPNLTIIDISMNRFRGSLPPSVFSSPKLRVFAAAANCISGSLPSTLCMATSLEVLVLDGLGSAMECQVPILAGFNGHRSTQKITGSIDSCIYTAFPRIKTLHLSGNKFQGSIPSSLASWPRMLDDLSVSHNRLTGQLSSTLQQQLGRFSRFDFAYNKLSGVLSSVSLSNRTVLNLVVNRLSGTLSKAVQSAAPGKVNVLDGNLFDCLSSGEGLPKNDPYRERYNCGSDQFDAFLYVSGSFFFPTVFFAMLVPRVRAYLGPGKVISANIPILGDFRYIRRFCAGCFLLFTLALLPLYGGLTAFAGTRVESYSWAVSAAFKSGVPCAGILLVFWSLVELGIFYAIVKVFGRIVRKNEVIPGSNVHHMTFGPSMSPEDSSGVKKDEFSLFAVRWRLSARLALIFALNVLCILVPNIGYVIITVTTSKAIQVLLSTCLTIYKQLWSSSVLPRLLRSQFFYFGVTEDDIKRLKIPHWLLGGFGFEMVLGAFNVVIAPSFAFMLFDSNCFKAVFVAPPGVTSAYQSTTCTFMVDTNIVVTDSSKATIFQFLNGQKFFTNTVIQTAGGYKTITQVSSSLDCQRASYDTVLSYQPSFFYNYECSNSLVQIYSPLFMIMMFSSTLGLPLFYSLVLLVADKWPKLRSKLLRLIPRILMRSKEELQIHQPTINWDDAPVDNPEVNSDDTTHRYYVLDVYAVFLAILSDLMILVSFGTVVPLLGLTVIVSLAFRTVRWHHYCSDFLARGHGVDHLFSDLQAFSRHAHPIFQTRWFMVAFSGFFLSMFLFDIGGDSLGWKKSIYLPILIIIVPCCGGFIIDKFFTPSHKEAQALTASERRIIILTRPRHRSRRRNSLASFQRTSGTSFGTADQAESGDDLEMSDAHSWTQNPLKERGGVARLSARATARSSTKGQQALTLETQPQETSSLRLSLNLTRHSLHQDLFNMTETGSVHTLSAENP